MTVFRRTLVLVFAVTVVLTLVADAFVSHNYGANCARSLTHRRCVHRSTSSVTTMAANRRARRMADDKKKGSPKKAASGPSNRAAGKSDAKWLQVLDASPDIEPGKVKVVSGKYKGQDKFFTLAAHGGRYFAISEACGRCKFPLINGKVMTLDENNKAEDVVVGAEEDPEAEVAIGCPLCGAVFNMATGDVVGEQPRGFAQGVMSKLLSQQVAERVKHYDARALSSGAVVVRVD